MHELSIVEQTLTLVREIALQENLHSVHTIRLRVGRLRQVEPEILNFLFDTVKKGTIAEHANLELSVVEVTVLCNICGARSTPRASSLRCTKCSSTDTTIETGKELLIESIEGD